MLRAFEFSQTSNYSCSTLYFMYNLSLQPRSKLLYSTLPNGIALSNAWEALGLFRNQNCQDMGSCWFSLFHQHISQIFCRSSWRSLRLQATSWTWELPAWGCKPHPKHEHSLVGDEEEGCQWWFEMLGPVNDRLYSHKLAITYHKTSSPRNLKKSTTYFICYGHLSSPKLLTIPVLLCTSCTIYPYSHEASCYIQPFPTALLWAMPEKHWDSSETRIAKTWVAAGFRFFTNTFLRSFADLLGDPWGCKPHPEHENSLLEAASHILNMSTPWLEMRKKAVSGGSKCLGLLMIDYTHTSWQ